MHISRARPPNEEEASSILELSAMERAFFAASFRGKLRVAELLFRVGGLRGAHFEGYARLPSGWFYLDSRHRLDRAMLFGGFEQELVEWVQRNFSGISMAWDIGAHHAEYTVPLARCVRRGGKVYSFEAFPDSAYVLERTVCANSLDSIVTVLAKAITSHTGEADLILSSNGSENHSLRPWVASTQQRLSVPATTLDECTRQYGVPDFVKIDIEGGELAAFRGGSELLAMRRTTFLFESEAWDESRQEVHDLLVASGYSLSTVRKGQEQRGTGGRAIVARPSLRNV